MSKAITWAAKIALSSRAQKAILLLLATVADSNMVSRIAVRTLAISAGLSERQTRRHLAALRQAKLISALSSGGREVAAYKLAVGSSVGADARTGIDTYDMNGTPGAGDRGDRDRGGANVTPVTTSSNVYPFNKNKVNTTNTTTTDKNEFALKKQPIPEHADLGELDTALKAAWPSRWKEIHDEILKLIFQESFDAKFVQELIDELTGKIIQQKANNPAPYFRGMIQKAKAGMFMFSTDGKKARGKRLNHKIAATREIILQNQLSEMKARYTWDKVDLSGPHARRIFQIAPKAGAQEPTSEG